MNDNHHTQSSSTLNHTQDGLPSPPIIPLTSSHPARQHSHPPPPPPPSENAIESPTTSATNATTKSSGKEKSDNQDVKDGNDGNGKRNKRKRTSQACARCRKLRAACDGARPCGKCTSVNLQDGCVYETAQQRRAKAMAPNSATAASSNENQDKMVCTECRRRKMGCNGARPCAKCTSYNRQDMCVYEPSSIRKNRAKSRESATARSLNQSQLQPPSATSTTTPTTIATAASTSISAPRIPSATTSNPHASQLLPPTPSNSSHLESPSQSNPVETSSKKRLYSTMEVIFFKSRMIEDGSLKSFGGTQRAWLDSVRKDPSYPGRNDESYPGDRTANSLLSHITREFGDLWEEFKADRNNVRASGLTPLEMKEKEEVTEKLKEILKKDNNRIQKEQKEKFDSGSSESPDTIVIFAAVVSINQAAALGVTCCSGCFSFYCRQPGCKEVHPYPYSYFNHQMSHSEEPWYYCHCGALYSHFNSLKQHLKRKRNEVNHSSQQEDSTLSQTQHLFNLIKENAFGRLRNGEESVMHPAVLNFQAAADQLEESEEMDLDSLEATSSAPSSSEPANDSESSPSTSSSPSTAKSIPTSDSSQSQTAFLDEIADLCRSSLGNLKPSTGKSNAALAKASTFASGIDFNKLHFWSPQELCCLCRETGIHFRPEFLSPEERAENEKKLKERLDSIDDEKWNGDDPPGDPQADDEDDDELVMADGSLVAQSGEAGEAGGDAEGGGEVDAEGEKLWCHCRRPESIPMIGCDGNGCPYEWFHYECVGVTEDPPQDVDWFCSACKGKSKSVEI